MLSFLAIFAAVVSAYAPEPRRACGTLRDRKYLVEVHVHIEDQVAKEMCRESGVDFSATFPEWAPGFLDTIARQINEQMSLYDVEVALKLSRERENAAHRKTSCGSERVVLSKLEETMHSLLEAGKSVGLRLYVWGCLRQARDQKRAEVLGVNTCGRLGGILWFGLEALETDIKSIVAKMVALQQTQRLRVTERESAYSDVVERQELCAFVFNCVGVFETPVGRIMYKDTRESLLAPDFPDATCCVM